MYCRKQEWLATPYNSAHKKPNKWGPNFKTQLSTAKPQNPLEPNTAQNGRTKRERRGNGGKVRKSRVHLGNQAHLGTLWVRRADVCGCVRVGGGVRAELHHV